MGLSETQRLVELEMGHPLLRRLEIASARGPLVGEGRSNLAQFSEIPPQLLELTQYRATGSALEIAVSPNETKRSAWFVLRTTDKFDSILVDMYVFVQNVHN